MTQVTDEQVRREAIERTPAAAAEVEGQRYGCFPAEELEKTVKDDVTKLRDAKVLEGVDIRGFILETETGIVRELDV